MKPHTSILFLTLAGLCHAAPAWSDFEQDNFNTQWQAGGAQAIMARIDAPQGTPDGGPSGKMMRFQTTGKTLAASRSDNHPLPKNLPDCEAMSFWIHSEASADSPVVVDVMFSERDRKAAFWRKLEVTESGWQQVTLPLKWFRWENGRVPRWDAVTNFVLRSRGPVAFGIDDIRFIDEDPQAGAEMSADNLKQLAFGDNNSAARSHVTDEFWVLTDAPGVDLDAVSQHLGEVLKKAREEFRLAEKPARPARIIIYQNEEDYRAFVPRLASQLGAAAAPPTSDGYHVSGIALSWWIEPPAGVVRPVITHEFVHTILSNYMLIDSAHSDWWQEGVASLFQMRTHPQDDFWELVGEGLEKPEMRTPLEELTNGQSIPMHRYWQAATIVEMLTTDPGYKDKIFDLIAAIRKTGSTDLRPLLEPVYGKDFEQFTQDWLRWTAGKIKANEPGEFQ
jgi:hypothetical protein